ncbi:MAG: bacillithiol biosynthesis deacetylase BshB1 [Cyclobacteriaceae bacterium]|jgi:bacillithiol biosynthesis deacetylase BshB1|nr:bacillithiol biosynthesis deacetylase BshB1 [Cyclobacteriaceae bacterium]
MKLDILVLASHPDDAELCTGGTLAKHIALGYKAGIVDFTRGELGTRGTVEIRAQEAARASEILGLSARENLGFADGFFRNDEVHQREVIRIIRKYQPDIVLANAIYDRHSDHGRAAELAADACFLSGLARVETSLDGAAQKPWRPKAVYHYIQSQFIEPDLIVDISDFWEQKVASYMAYKSQVFDPASKEPETYISSPQFLKLIEARAVEFGNAIGTKYGEGFTVRRYPGVKSLLDLL